jgi:hypothetical protein
MPDFGLEERTRAITDSWFVRGAPRVNAEGVDLFNGLLPERTQEGHIAHFIEQVIERGGTGYRIGSVPLYYSVFEALFDNSGNTKHKSEIKRIRRFLQEQLANTFLLTSTRIRHTPEGQRDIVMHDYRLPSMQTIEADITGPDEWIANARNPEVYGTLCGSGDTEKVNRVFKWLTERNGYLWRAKYKSKSYETVAVFYSCLDRAYLNCFRDPGNSGCALGVRLVAEGDTS